MRPKQTGLYDGVGGPATAGLALAVVEPGGWSRDGPWTVHAWPSAADGPGLVALRLPFPLPVGTPYLANGWQSWSGARLARLGGHVQRPAGRGLAGAVRHPLAAPPYDGDESYGVLAADGFVAGVLEGDAALVARPRLGELLVVLEGPGPHPPVWTAEGDAGCLLADLLGRAGGRVPATTPPGWCSWYGWFEYVSQEIVGAELDRATRRGVPLGPFQVDDGWQAAIGDWRRTAGRFPDGLAGLAARIAGAGFRPGLWVAPFVAAPASDLAADRPEWLLRSPSGGPVPAIAVPHWGGATHALDVTRPDVLDWLEDLFAHLTGLGFTFLKLDFLYAAALPGRRARPVAGDAALRTALEAVRRGAGPDAFLVACGCPLWPAIGLVDAMRVGPDVAPYWSPVPSPDIPAGCEVSLANGWRSARRRSPFHGRLWANDPDCVLLRRTNTRLTPEQSRGWARWVAGSGQLLTLGDPLSDLDDEDLALWAELVRQRGGTGG